MFAVNDIVMYGNTGVCKIVDIRLEKFSKKECMYYILKPVATENSTVYCPVDTDKIKIRRLLSKSEINELIRLMPDTETEWVESDAERKEKFGAVLKEGEPKELVKLLKTLHFNQTEKLRLGKKFHACDEKIMKEAEKILHGEFAHVLHIGIEEVVPFIMGELDKSEGMSNAACTSNKND